MNFGSLTTRKHSHFWRNFWRKTYSSDISDEILTGLREIWNFTIRRYFVGNILGISDELSFVKNNRRNTDDSWGRLHDLGYRFGVYVFVGNSSEISDELPTKWKISVGNSSEIFDKFLINLFLGNFQRISDGLQNFRRIFITNFLRTSDENEF